MGECDSSPKLLTVKQVGSVIYRKAGVVLQLKYCTSQSHPPPLCEKPTTPPAADRADAYKIKKKNKRRRKQKLSLYQIYFSGKARKDEGREAL